MIRALFTFSILMFSFCTYAQNDYLKIRDQQLADSFELFYKMPLDSNEIFRSELRLKMGQILADEESLNFPFDSLSEKIRIIQSADGKIKIFSWNQISGGTWHDMYSIAQFKTSESKMDTCVLSNSGENEGFSDVINYEIHQLTNHNEIFYLVLGFGTHGSGHHHKLARIFKFKDHKLIQCLDCFNGEKELVLEVPRAYNIVLTFNPIDLNLTFQEFKNNDQSSFEKPTGKTLVLKWKNGKFKY